MKSNKNKKSLVFDKLKSRPNNQNHIRMTSLKTVPQMEIRVKLFYKCITQL